MSINGLGSGDLGRVGVPESTLRGASGYAPQRASAPADPRLSPSDAVSLSAAAKSLAAAREATRQAPDVRDARVREVKQRLEDGTYTINPDQLARALVRQATLGQEA